MQEPFPAVVYNFRNDLIKELPYTSKGGTGVRHTAVTPGDQISYKRNQPRPPLTPKLYQSGRGGGSAHKGYNFFGVCVCRTTRAVSPD